MAIYIVFLLTHVVLVAFSAIGGEISSRRRVKCRCDAPLCVSTPIMACYKLEVILCARQPRVE